MDRVFLDANVLFSAAYAPDSRLRELWSLPGVRLVTSEFALEEARRNLQVHCPSGLPDLVALAARTEIVSSVPARVRLPSGTQLPERDMPIVATAVAAECTHLLTGDKRHFGRLYGRRVSGTRVLTPGQYVASRR